MFLPNSHWHLACLPSVRLLKRPLGGKLQTAQPTLNGEVISLSPSIVRIVKHPRLKCPKRRFIQSSETPEKVEIFLQQNGNTVSMTSGKMTVTLRRSYRKSDLYRPTG